MEAKYSILEWRNGLRQSGISDAGCPRMEEVLRAPAAHGVSSFKNPLLVPDLDLDLGFLSKSWSILRNPSC